MDRQAVKWSCLTNTSLYSAGFSHLPVTNVPDCCIKLYIQPILQLQSKGFPSNLRLVILLQYFRPDIFEKYYSTQVTIKKNLALQCQLTRLLNEMLIQYNYADIQYKYIMHVQVYDILLLQYGSTCNNIIKHVEI